RRLYRQSTEIERTWKLTQIEKARAVAHRPVFTIEYASVGDTRLAEWATRESLNLGFKPYVTVKELTTLP
ncbi:MAG TPA: hypothetical protein VNI54_17925, partial [Thermoanaerobaculia bacterium]|nr:hypothetical protein [Thermoanaerobaculia bacterium]